MAIVIPVAVEGVRIANLAGQVGLRKTAAARVAERVLNELTLTGGIQSAGQRGRMREGILEFEWTTESSSWTDSRMRLVTVQVVYQVQGRDYDVRLSTLLDASAL
jgi:hypothetical protein